MSTRQKHQSKSAFSNQRSLVTAIIVDGGFYRRRAKALFGDKTPAERADELLCYCHRHIHKSRSSLFRIYYYDCLPSTKVLYHPLKQDQVNLGKTPEYAWMTDFLKELVKKRKVALRRGEELETQYGYQLKKDALKKLCRKVITVDDLSLEDFSLDIT